VAKLILVRHGRAAAGWDAHSDPGLDDVGRAQAAAVAEALAPLGPLPIVVSPLQRTVETALPLASRWSVEPVVDARVAEVPSPTEELAERGTWLARAMAGTWADLGEPWMTWRDALVGALVDLPSDTIVVTHFIAINAAVGNANGDDRVVSFAPANASTTTLTNDDGRLTLVSLGDEARTVVN
jgi:broad specificity phosphatase PhoE